MNDELSGIISTIQGMAGNAAKPEVREADPGDATPTIVTKGQSGLVTEEMTAEEVGKWQERIKNARERNDKIMESADILLDEYLPIVKKSGEAETVKVNRHFRDVHTKIGSLFYRSPDLILTARDPGPGGNQIPNPMGPELPPLAMEDIISIKQSILAFKLGRDGIKANRLMDELLFDVLAWAGIGCCKVGYKCVTQAVQEPVLGPDPNYQPAQTPGGVLNLMTPQAPPQVPQIGADGKPIMRTVQVPIYEEWYARRFSPKKLLCNEDLRSTRFDEDATWMGMDFYMTPETAQQPPENGGLGLTENEVSALVEDDRIHKYVNDELAGQVKLLHFVELAYKAASYGKGLHPKKLMQLILCEGVTERPIVHRPHPDQTFDERGQLSKDSIDMFPYRVLTIRDIADFCYPQSDAAFTNSGIKQLGTFMRQRVKQRDANIGKFLFDTDAFEDAEIDMLKNGESGDYIGVKPGGLNQGVEKLIAQTTQIKSTPDDNRTEELLRRDLDETLGIGAVQSGNTERAVHTATEINDVNQAVKGRNDKELSRVVDFYLDMVRMVDQLLMRYADEQEYIEITGEDGARRLQAWDKRMVSGRYLYDIAPDSQLRADTEIDFQQAMNFYNLSARDPLVNRMYILKRLARTRGWDPAKIIIPPQPQEPKGPEPSIGFSFKGEDLMLIPSTDPMNPTGLVPANPIAVKLLVKLGALKAEDVGLPPEANPQPVATQPPAAPGAPGKIAPVARRPVPQPPHGAPSPQGTQGGPGEAINQHTASNSGGKPNAPGAPNHRGMMP